MPSKPPSNTGPDTMAHMMNTRSPRSVIQRPQGPTAYQMCHDSTALASAVTAQKNFLHGNFALLQILHWSDHTSCKELDTMNARVDAAQAPPRRRRHCEVSHYSANGR